MNAAHLKLDQKDTWMLEVLYCDETLIAISKPSGLLVHRGWANDSVVALDLVRAELGRWVYPVHRLDRATSGVLVFAQSSEAAAAIQAQFEQGSVEKRYLALVRGITPESGEIDHPIPKSEGGARVPAFTFYRRLFAENRYCLVEAVPRTGRLHQIRRHLKHISHPVIGDVNYGKGEHNRYFREVYGLFRLALHARELQLTHPKTNARLRFQARVPDDLRLPLLRLGVPGSILEFSKAALLAVP